MEIAITVTQEDITKGQDRKGPSFPFRVINCPLALACKRAGVDNFSHINADGEIVLGKFGDHTYLRAEGAWNFVRRADSGRNIHPQTFIFKEVK